MKMVVAQQATVTYIRRKKMRTKLLWFMWVGIAVVGFAACNPMQTAPDVTERPPSPSATDPGVETPAPATLEAVPMTPASEVIEEETMPVPTVSRPSGSSAERLITQAKEDLAQRLDITVDEIDLVEMESVVWPDSSLGCPQPGMAYTQVQQDGYRIRLQVDKRPYDYHGGGARGPFLCQKAGDDELAPPPGSGDE
jgi:hypothetical protein